MNMKKIIFLMVDSLMPAILEKGFQKRIIPALQFLRERGQYRADCVTVFPTMTASVDSSLATGVYPNVHKVPSLIWYDPVQKEIINYINGYKCVSRLGLGKCARNVLLNLNEKHLSRSVKTIFEELAGLGLTSASINLIIHRGLASHKLHLPVYMKWISGIKGEPTVSGPEILTLGAIAYPALLQHKLKSYAIGLTKLCGINDDFAIDVSAELIKQGKQPDFMLIYLPDNDHKIHKKSPQHGELPLIQVDQQLQKLLNAYGSWEKALQENIIIVSSDHGQTHVGTEEDYNIDMDHLLHDYRVLQLGEEVSDDHHLVVCNNERMAYLYPLQPGIDKKIVALLKAEARIDLIAWKEDNQVVVMEGGSGREMSFKPNGPFVDPYGSTWTLTGDLAVMDISLKGQKIEYGDYPDGLARLYGALFSQDFPLIVITARPRFEFKSRYYPTHNNGGSHGSLHKWDSLIPLIVAGDESGSSLPSRLVDFKGYILNLFKSHYFQ